MQFLSIITLISIGSAAAAVRPVVTTQKVRPKVSTAAATTTKAAAATTCASPLPTYGCLPLVDQSVWQSAMLNQHNQYRARHNINTPMTWNSALSAAALKNAQMNSDANTFSHSTGTGYGENIANEYGYNSPTYLGYLWYNEIMNYNYANPGFAENTGHFTQVVWSSSTQLGCAFVQNQISGAANYGYYYLACEYSPPGNVGGQYQANVAQPNSNPYPTQPSMYL